MPTANNKKLTHNVQIANFQNYYYCKNKLNYQISRRRFCFFHLGYTNRKYVQKVCSFVEVDLRPFHTTVLTVRPVGELRKEKRSFELNLYIYYVWKRWKMHPDAVI